MSWEIINQVLGLATIDAQFAQELLKEPLAAARRRGFQLTPQEQKVFSETSASNLGEFSQHLLQALNRNYSDKKRNSSDSEKGE